MAVEELVFRTKVDTGTSVKDVDKLTNALDGAGEALEEIGDKGADALKELNARVKENNFTMGEASQIIEQYATIALQAGRETPVGQEAIRMAGELTHIMGDLQKEIANAGVEYKGLQAGLELASALTAGYGAYQGVVALTGVENEALAQTFVKLQAIQSVLAGIESVRLSLEKESLLMTKAKVVWTKTMTAVEIVYATAVGTTTGAMKALRIAMLAIPIIAIIAGIIALIAALASFMSSAQEAEAMNNKVNESFDKQNALIDANTRAYKRNADNKRALMESELATAQELFEFDKQRILEEEKLRKQSVKLLEDTIPQKREAYQQALREENYELAKTIKEEIGAMRDKYKTFIELDGQYAVDIKILENKRRNEINKEREAEAKALQDAEDKAEQERLNKGKAWAEKRKRQREEENQKRLEENILLEDLLVKNITNSNDRKLAELNLGHRRELEALKLKYGLEAEVVKQATIAQENERMALLAEFREAQEAIDKEEQEKLAEKAEQELEAQRVNDVAMLEAQLIKMREDFEATQELKAELALIEMEQALLQENLTEGEKFKIREEYAKKIDDINSENVEREIERQRQLQETTQNVLQAGLQSASDLANAFFDFKLSKAEKGSAEELRIEKRKFEVNKKLQIAQAIMQGVQGVQAAFASGSAIPVVGVAMGPLFAALAAVTAGLNVAKISNAKFEGGSTSISAPTTPSVSVPSVQGSAPEDVSTLTQGLPGSGSQTPTAKVTLLQSELEESLSDSAKVSVVSTVG